MIQRSAKKRKTTKAKSVTTRPVKNRHTLTYMSCGGVKVWYNFYINQFALITQAEREDDFYETQ